MAVVRYRVDVAGRAFEIEVESGPDSTLVRLDGRPLEAELGPADATGVRRLRIGDSQRDLLVRLTTGGCAVAVEGVALDLAVEDERSARLAQFGRSAQRAAGQQ